MNVSWMITEEWKYVVLWFSSILIGLLENSRVWVKLNEYKKIYVTLQETVLLKTIALFMVNKTMKRWCDLVSECTEVFVAKAAKLIQNRFGLWMSIN